MEKQKLFQQLLREYYEQFGDISIIVDMETILGTDVAIELLQNRNGAKIVELYTEEPYNDIQPEYVYE
jgi:hypothetical protein